MIWGNGFRDLGPSNGGACARPRARRVAVLGVEAGGGRPFPLRCYPRECFFYRFLIPNPAFGGQFGPQNKLIEGQPNEYDVICWNASVLAFHLWPTIFAGAPFQLQHICRNGVPPRSRTTTPLGIYRQPAALNRPCSTRSTMSLITD